MQVKQWNLTFVNYCNISSVDNHQLPQVSQFASITDTIPVT